MLIDMNFAQSALNVIEIEAQAISILAQRIDAEFERACSLMLACRGRVILTGMGKSGHIARKIAATFASTGTPAFFVHPAEASHGDLGMITKDDLVIALSHSGQTEEILKLLPLIKRLAVPLISFTGQPESLLAKAADINIDLRIQQEACPLGLAPTTSTTVALVMGDAFAVALLEARGFTADDFALAHPAGSLGKRLLLRVEDIWHSGDALPLVQTGTPIREALIEIAEKKLGICIVVDAHQQLLGLITDGDVRRSLCESVDIHQDTVDSIMSTGCKTMPEGALAAEALSLMQKYMITSLLVLDQQQKPKAVIHIHDILKAGLI